MLDVSASLFCVFIHQFQNTTCMSGMVQESTHHMGCFTNYMPMYMQHILWS